MSFGRAVVGGGRDERAALIPVGLKVRPHDGAVDLGEAVKAQVPAAVGQVMEERDGGVGVGRRRRAEPKRPPVSQDHIDGVQCHG
jgi:hypothetical protein